MIYERIEDIKNGILAETDIFTGGGWVIKPGQYQRINGLTDEARQYFYIDFQEGSRQLEFDDQSQGCEGVHMVTANLKLIARVEDYTLQSAMNYIISQLLDFEAKITAYTQDTEYIFMNETEEEIQDNWQLLRIDFTVSLPYRPFNCTPIQCKPC